MTAAATLSTDTSDVVCPATPSMSSPDVDYSMTTDNVEIADTATTTTSSSSKRKILLAVTAAAALVVVGVVVALVSSFQAPTTTSISVGAAGDVSVCYDSYNSYTAGNIEYHFKRIKERFSGVRTYQTQGLRNHIDVAAETGLVIYAGVWLKNDQWFKDMQAALDGARRHPNSVKAILVGNEELLGGEYNQWFVLEKVRHMRKMLNDAGLWYIKVGSVQTDGDWLNSGSELAKECDVMGVNIHPFFGASDNSKLNPVEDLNVRWIQMVNRFGGKVVLTETGWPTSGGTVNGHVPSMHMAKKYMLDVNAWAKRGNGGDTPAYFMFHDNNGKWVDYEKSFGLAWDNGFWKFDFNTVDPAKDYKGIVFFNRPNEKVLGAQWNNMAVDTHTRWGWSWKDDFPSIWSVWETKWQIVTWDAANKRDLCLDAYEPKRGGAVHLWPCDANNGNQKWKYDRGTQQIRHLTHHGLCLDMRQAEGGPLHLWDCLDHEKLQKFEWWVI
ncbi:hypothetical protein DYB35_001961 [Aphanomyces astaci]|uniref:glucan endo-1,3-beta-D-glucosidase n=1 Tax=Aphanomyces astaci TaxID=112090 RepID=A0A3R7A7E7_APHAT|nr:hypothetical protein DYB35_001961 [Aphanomyces astaci]